MRGGFVRFIAISFSLWSLAASAGASPATLGDFDATTARFLLDPPSQLAGMPSGDWESAIGLCMEMGWNEREFELRRARYESGSIASPEAGRLERRRIGELAILIGRDRDALRYLQVGPDRGDVALLAMTGLACLRVGDVERGTPLIRAAIENGAPSEDLLLFRLGQALSGVPAEQDGIPVLLEVAKTGGRYSKSALHTAADRLFRGGEAQKAEEILRKKYGSSFSDLTNARLLERLARGAANSGEFEHAARLWRRVLDGWPSQRSALDAFRSLRRLEEEGKIPRESALALSGARAARQNSRHDEAIHLLRPLIDLPENNPLKAKGILEMGKVSYGTERFKSALRYFDQLADGSSDEAASALLNRARSYKKLGEWANAIAAYELFVDRFPGSKIAPEVQWEIAWRTKINGDYAQAAESFQQVTKLFPWSDFGKKAPLQRGLCLDLAGDTKGGLKVLESLVGGGGGGKERDDALFWIADMSERLGDDGRAQEAYRELTTEFPETFYGLRAAGRLGETVILPAHDVEIDGSDPALAWIRGWGRKPVSSIDDEELRFFAAIGEWSAARREASRLREKHRSSAESLLELARTCRRLGLSDYTIRCGRSLQDLAVRAGVDDVHPFLLALIYPIGYFDLVIAEAQQQGDVDPFFVLGLMRQESWFQRDAHSSADARGLMQIIPRTGKHIAGQLGEGSGWDAGQLYRPPVNIRYGIWYVRSLIRRYGGKLSVVASAYNAGEGNADIWKARNEQFPAEEFVELVNYSETREYIKRTLSGYWIYRSLYRDLAEHVLLG